LVIGAGSSHVTVGVVFFVLPPPPEFPLVVADAPLPHEHNAATTDAANTSRTTDQDVTLYISVSFQMTPKRVL
jgi:hypothetical protein